jgi:hypothetical protein
MPVLLQRFSYHIGQIVDGAVGVDGHTQTFRVTERCHHGGKTIQASRFNNDPANCRRLYLSNTARNRMNMPRCRPLSALRM